MNRSVTKTAGGDCATYCVFRYRGHTFAVTASCLREVSSSPKFAELPVRSRGLAGICHLRNEFVPVLRVPVRNESQAKLDEAASKMLTLQGAHGDWGLLADEVVAITPLDFTGGPSKYQDEWSAAWLGSTTFREEVVQILDPTGLYRAVEDELSRSQESSIS